MQKNDLLRNDEGIVRVLELAPERILIVDCLHKSVPRWVNESELCGFALYGEDELSAVTHITPPPIDDLDAESRGTAYRRFAMIAGILPFIGDGKERRSAVRKMADYFKVSKQTINQLLWFYLVYQNISVLAPKRCNYERELTTDEKNMRWALNKFFYTQRQNSLRTAYTYMLKERYCDSNGVLLPEYPTIHQFKYFYRKHKKQRTYLISRNGIKDYEKNYRPLLGESIQEFAPNVGVAMLDATTCDIYLVNDAGKLVGRPILVLAVDGYSSMVCGYSLLWEGGVYSLRGLMLNVISDKVEHCKRFGISIDKSDWDCDKLPAVLVTDMGSEFISQTFEQIAELGVTIINLPAARPDLKGNVEKAFDLIQGYYKPHLKGKGVIEPDYQQRGAHDYRKDACLTLKQFEVIVLRCIIYYNSKRMIENFPYTAEMLEKQIQPFAAAIWEYGCHAPGADFIRVSREELILTLLPRTEGKFSRKGLKVNGLRYRNDAFIEQYLAGGSVVVAYNPDDVSAVWLVEAGAYIPFALIESRFSGADLPAVIQAQTKKKELIKSAAKSDLQAQIDLANHIEAIASNAVKKHDVDRKHIQQTRQRERRKNHVDYMQESGVKNA